MRRPAVSLAAISAVALAVAALGVAIPVAAQEYPEANITITLSDPVVVPGQEVVLEVPSSESPQGETWYVYIDTVPQPTGGGELLLATGTVGPNGSVRAVFVVPQFAYGEYRVRLIAPYAPPPAPTEGFGVQGARTEQADLSFWQKSFSLVLNEGGDLPAVGSSPFPTLRVAAVCVVAGLGAVLVVVRRRRLAS